MTETVGERAARLRHELEAKRAENEAAWAPFRQNNRGTIVSMPCTIGWHGEPCKAARDESGARVPCSCGCHS